MGVHPIKRMSNTIDNRNLPGEYRDMIYALVVTLAVDLVVTAYDYLNNNTVTLLRRITQTAA
jgi:hypothetical protein